MAANMRVTCLPKGAARICVMTMATAKNAVCFHIMPLGIARRLGAHLKILVFTRAATGPKLM